MSTFYTIGKNGKCLQIDAETRSEAKQKAKDQYGFEKFYMFSDFRPTRLTFDDVNRLAKASIYSSEMLQVIDDMLTSEPHEYEAELFKMSRNGDTFSFTDEYGDDISISMTFSPDWFVFSMLEGATMTSASIPMSEFKNFKAALAALKPWV